MLRVNNVLIDPDEITYVLQDEKDVNKITVCFDNGEKLTFIGAEAMELWRILDKDGGWRDDA